MLRQFFCPQCKSVFPPSGLKQRCLNCGSVLVAGYDYQNIKTRVSPGDLQSRAHSIWRYQELLPVVDEGNIISLGEGFSPVLPLRRVGENTRVSHLLIKDDGIMPLGSFRSRLASVTLSKAAEEMVKVVAARAGQVEAFALAAYAARAGIGAVLVVRRDALQEPFEQNILASGASLFTYDCPDAEADALVNECAMVQGWFNASPFHNPYRLEGAKSIGLEIAEIFEWRLPDVIVVPAVGGTVLAGIYRALRDLISLGWVQNKLPRLVAVQAEGRALLVEAWKERKLSVPIIEQGDELGFGEKVEFISQAEYLALDAIYKTFGIAVAVSAAEAAEAQALLLLNEGMVSSVSGAATLAAALKLDEQGWFNRGERVLLYNPEGSLTPALPPLPARASALPMNGGLLQR